MNLKQSLTMLAIGACLYKPASAEEPKPDNDLSANVSLVNDYSYRGISQSRLQPALQGFATFGFAFVGTNCDAYVGPVGDHRNLAKTRLVVSALKTF